MVPVTATGCPAVNVLVNDGPEANQAVPHAHIHLIPLNNEADVDFKRPKLKLTTEQLIDIADRIRKNFEE